MTYPTNPIYKLYKVTDMTGQVIEGVRTLKGNLTYDIPFVSDNTHYQEYLEWVAAGNTAEAAD